MGNDWQCDLGQINVPFWTSAYPSVKREYNSTHRTVVSTERAKLYKVLRTVPGTQIILKRWLAMIIVIIYVIQNVRQGSATIIVLID